MVELLLASGADLESPETDSGATPLHVAAGWGRVDVVRFLLAQGANPKSKNKQGLTPEQVAAASQQQDVVKLLSTTVEQD